MSGIIGSKLNIRGSGRIAKLGTDGQVLTSAGAGVSAAFEAASAGGTSWQSVETGSTFSAVAGNGYPVNTTAQACTVTLPASASVGDTIEFTDYARTWGTNALTIDQNSLKFQGDTTPNPLYNTEGQSVTITYVDATQGWIPTNDGAVSDETAPPYDVDFLVIAGGGGGGNSYAGGGGAGGYRTSYASETSGGGGSTESDISLTVGDVYTVTVGAGGTAGATYNSYGTAGSASSIVGTGVSITTVGGGKGGYGENVDQSANLGGGSGGGGGASTGSPRNTPGAGTANQGYAGGAGATAGTGYGGGGGGGAGAVGVTYSGGGGDGGAGLSSAITGSSVARGGGGGAGSWTDEGSTASGGTGGGGSGANHLQAAGNGTANTGGGGGGAGDSAGAGGTGVVILRMTTAKYSGTYTNAETPIVDGSDTILVFNTSGSYTA
jgi:hypothetical protein